MNLKTIKVHDEINPSDHRLITIDLIIEKNRTSKMKSKLLQDVYVFNKKLI